MANDFIDVNAQKEAENLDKFIGAVEKHQKWLLDNKTGERLVGFGELRNCTLPNIKLKRAKLKGIVIENVVFSNVNFDRANFNEAVFKNVIFVQCTFTSTKMKKAIFENVKFDNCEGSGINFNEAIFNTVTFEETEFFDANLEYSVMDNVTASKCDFDTARMRAIRLREVEFTNTDLANTDFQFSSIKDSKIKMCKLSFTKFSGTTCENIDFSGSRFFTADFGHSMFKKCDFTDVNFRDANVSNVDFSCTKGITSQIDYCKQNFEFTDEGLIAYKVFNHFYPAPEDWKIEKGAVLTENVNYNKSAECGCGINVASREWIEENIRIDRRWETLTIWKVLIRWEWLMGVSVPFEASGKIRCEKVELVESYENGTFFENNKTACGPTEKGEVE